MRQAVTKKMAMAVGIAALAVLGANLLQTAGVISLPSAVAQEEKNPEEPVAAAEPAAPAAGADANAGSQVREQQSYLGWFIHALGWIFTPVFLIISFSFVAFLVMNILSARRDSIAPKHLAEAFEAHLNEKKFQEAYDLAKSDESMLGQVLAAGMQSLQQGYDKAIEAMGQAGEEENLRLEQRLSYISLIGAIAPMVGLLGTVYGMVLSFVKIANSDVTPKPRELAEGISTALVTTLVGLVLAIPAIIAFNLLKNRITRLVLEVSLMSSNLMSRFETMNKK
ncbi:MAG TPA: MotA/TolQ/ExbB proton channel family protein [Pirellulaceae bacterium]|nr:MotA/TolQ/ExbB proton channel family protein [Pirellulaceae bacterium]